MQRRQGAEINSECFTCGSTCSTFWGDFYVQLYTVKTEKWKLEQKPLCMVSLLMKLFKPEQRTWDWWVLPGCDCNEQYRLWVHIEEVERDGHCLWVIGQWPEHWWLKQEILCLIPGGWWSLFPLTWQSHANKSLWFYSSFSGLTLYEQ